MAAKAWGVMALGVVFLGTSLSAAAAESAPEPKEDVVTYRFDRMWPTLQQPWYFHFSSALSVDSSGHVYVTDLARVHKLDSDGAYLTSWGSSGSGPGQFDRPMGVASDTAGNVYVADSGNHRIQKFDAFGNHLISWGSFGSSDGKFFSPQGVAVDGAGNVFVADMNNNRIQKFDANGVHLLSWGSIGTDPGKFQQPCAVAVDAAGNVYVSDSWNDRIQKFTGNGGFVASWGSLGTGPVQFATPSGIALDASGNIYVADSGNDRVQVLDAAGNYVTEWGSMGLAPGEFMEPESIGVDASGNVYVLDIGNERVQKFASDGSYLTHWGSGGVELGRFNSPADVAVDASGNVYVADSWNDRIQKFTANGVFVDDWGTTGSGTGEFMIPEGIAVSASGYVYIADSWNDRIQKWTVDGVYVSSWDGASAGVGAFNEPVGLAVDASGRVYVADSFNDRILRFDANGGSAIELVTTDLNTPMGVAVDSSGNVFVADSGNNRIRKFAANGAPLAMWGSEGDGPGEFSWAADVAVDSAGNVYVTDMGNDRIQKFSNSGTFLTAWGQFGKGPGEFTFSFETGITVDADGNVIVADVSNNRIQKFEPITLTANAKAVIVAGGGSFPGNYLWDATRMCANFAYRTLTHQGFDKDSIFYLSSDSQLDLDNNGQPDDVDGDASNAQLQYALTQWAPAVVNGLPAGDVVVYLTDHGGNGAFRMNGSEILSSAQLDGWLDTLQVQISGRVVVVYDACDSGSFLAALGATAGQDRIVMTSTTGSEPAYFLSTGVISFSNFFWTNVFNGLDVRDAFTLARNGIVQAVAQSPLLDANGNGAGNEAVDYTSADNVYIGNGTALAGDPPVIVASSPAQSINGISTASLWVEPVDADGIARAWAVIQPPDFSAPSADNAVYSLPSVELFPADAGRWEGEYAGFTSAGVYTIALYARDRQGNTSMPATTSVTVDNPLHRRAVLIAGGPESEPLWTAHERVAAMGYEALKVQGYADEDIYFLSPVATSTGVDGTSVLSNVQYALTTWACANTQDATVYIVGAGTGGGIRLNATETLTPATLAGWLSTLEGCLAGTLTLICDADGAGAFLTAMQSPKSSSRILLASAAADESAAFLSEGTISFSSFFWQTILNGGTVGSGYGYAKVAMGFAAGAQTGQIDDNGNGLANERDDGRIAQYYRLGTGVLLAGDAPIIGSICPPQTLGTSTAADLWVEGVTTTGGIARVIAVIAPPGYDAGNLKTSGSLYTISLAQESPGRYRANCGTFTGTGTYDVSAYAIDTDGNVSAPKHTHVTRTGMTSDADVDGDGEVTAVDVQLVINKALGMAVSQDCDLDDNGQVNAVDVQLVINGALGI